MYIAGGTPDHMWHQYHNLHSTQVAVYFAPEISKVWWDNTEVGYLLYLLLCPSLPWKRLLCNLAGHPRLWMENRKHMFAVEWPNCVCEGSGCFMSNFHWKCEVIVKCRSVAGHLGFVLLKLFSVNENHLEAQATVCRFCTHCSLLGCCPNCLKPKHIHQVTHLTLLATLSPFGPYLKHTFLKTISCYQYVYWGGDGWFCLPLFEPLLCSLDETWGWEAEVQALREGGRHSHSKINLCPDVMGNQSFSL